MTITAETVVSPRYILEVSSIAWLYFEKSLLMSSANTICFPPINILNGFYGGLISLVSSFKLNLFLIMNGFSKLRNYYVQCLQIALKRMAFYELLSAYYSHVLLCHLCFELIFISEFVFF